MCCLVGVGVVKYGELMGSEEFWLTDSMISKNIAPGAMYIPSLVDDDYDT